MNLLTAAQLERARQRVREDAAAQRVAAAVLRAAAPWRERPDAVLRALVPEAGVPRALSVNYITGCPVHGSGPAGHGGYAQGGWRYDPFADRWRVVCAVGGESYPSNDFEAFYRSGMRDRSLLTGPYADDGWGWQAPGAPHRHWFVAYCCECLWHAILAGVEALAQAYLLHDDRACAHKALVLLDRIAEVYPAMDYGRQGMYGREFSPGYTGKILDQIAETGTACRLCRAVDAVRAALPADPVFGATAAATWAKLDAGIVQACLNGVYAGLIRGNYGTHQEALLTAALVRGDRETIARAVAWAADQTGEATPHKEMQAAFDDYIFRDKAAHAEGMRFALDNLLFREGIGWESSPWYNAGWVEHMARVAALLARLGVNLWDHPRLRRMLRWPAEMTCLGLFTPAIGDGGGPLGGLVQCPVAALRAAYQATRDPFAGTLLRQQQPGFDSVESLFEPAAAPAPAPAAETAAAAWLRRVQRLSHLMGGYGLALLRAGRGRYRCAVSVYYGRAATEHGHFDRLVLELFAHGRKLVPEHGYGEHAAEGQPPAIWTKNTLSHATVVVDGRRQDTQAPGHLEMFVACPGLSLVQVDAPAAYHHVAEYRRTVALIDVHERARYVLDLFRVTGGNQHDYSLHGLAGAFHTAGVALSPPQTDGSLAGPSVPREAIYDDDGLLDFARKGRSYYTYRGGGYSYLYDVQRAAMPGTWAATWHDGQAGLQALLLPAHEAIVAHGDPPRKAGNPPQLTYVLLRNRGDGIGSQFGAVLEPYGREPSVRSLEILAQTPARLRLRVVHTHGEDEIEHAVTPAGACFSRVRRDAAGRVVRLDVLGVGSAGRPGDERDPGDPAGGPRLSIESGMHGRVVSVDPERAVVVVERDAGSQPFRSGRLAGAVGRFTNGRRASAYTLTAVKGRGRRYQVCCGDDSFRIGRFVVTGIDPAGAALATKTYLYLASQGYYRGARLVDPGHQVWLPVEDVQLSPHRPGARRDGAVRLTAPADLAAHFRVGELAYLYDFGPGDVFSVTPHASAVRAADGRFRLRGNCQARLVL